MGTSAVFFDRDGILVQDKHLLTKASDIEIINGASELIATSRKLGFKTFMVTNQTVVARGLLSLDQAYALNALIVDMLKRQHPQAIFDAIYLCPHHPDAQVPEYKIQCQCRKPKPGMIIQAKNEHGLDLSNSFMIGDRPSDIVAGNRAGTNTILVKSDQLREQMIITDSIVELEETIAQWEVNQLSEIETILKKKNASHRGDSHGS